MKLIDFVGKEYLSEVRKKFQEAQLRSKRFSNTTYSSFSDYKKLVQTSMGLGSTIGRIHNDLIQKHEVYFEMSFDAGYDMAIKDIKELLDALLLITDEVKNEQ